MHKLLRGNMSSVIDQNLGVSRSSKSSTKLIASCYNVTTSVLTRNHGQRWNTRATPSHICSKSKMNSPTETLGSWPVIELSTACEADLNAVLLSACAWAPSDSLCFLFLPSIAFLHLHTVLQERMEQFIKHVMCSGEHIEERGTERRFSI